MVGDVALVDATLGDIALVDMALGDMQRLITAKAMIAIFCILEFIKVCNNRNSIVFDLLRLVL